MDKMEKADKTDKMNMNKFKVPGKMKEVAGSLIAPVNAGLRFIVNFCDMSGKYTGEVSKLIAKAYTKPREDYFSWYSGQRNFKMGEVKEVPVSSDIFVVNLLVKSKEGVFDNLALETSVKKLAKLAKDEKASVHISSLLMAEAPLFKDLLEKYVAAEGIHCYFYNEIVKAR